MDSESDSQMRPRSIDGIAIRADYFAGAEEEQTSESLSAPQCNSISASLDSFDDEAGVKGADSHILGDA